MTVQDRDLRKRSGFPAGINNLAPESAMPTDDGRVVSLREADNIDLDRSGRVRRRRGFAPTQATTLAHSGWSHPLVPYGLFVDAGQLHRFDSDETVHPLGTQVGNSPLSYELIASTVYYASQDACGIMTEAGELRAWAPEHPSGQPNLELVAGLGLPAGQYQVAVTFIDDLGRESGSTLAAVIDVPDGYGVRAFNIPQPLDAATSLINVYLTDANDQVLRRHTSLPTAGITDLNLGAKATGKVLDTQFLRPMPAGQVTSLFNGRHLVAAGETLMWSTPLRYGMYDPARGQMRFAGRIDVVAPVGRQGVLVAAGGRTYWLGGADPAAWTLDVVYGHGAVPGSCTEIPGTALGGEDPSPQSVWLARDGQIVVGRAGVVAPTKLGAAAIDDADRAAPLFRAEGGMQQLVMALRAPQRQGMAVTDTAVAHVIRSAP